MPSFRSNSGSAISCRGRHSHSLNVQFVPKNQMLRRSQSYLLQSLVVEFKGPELEAGGQGADGGQAEQELLRRAQRDVRIGQLSLLDLLLLLLCGGHGQDLLLRTEGGSAWSGSELSLTTCGPVKDTLVLY